MHALIANFADSGFVGATIFSTPLDSHLHNQFWSSTAQHLVTDRLEAKRTTLELYAPIFDHAVELSAKSLIVLMVAPFAVMPAIVFYGTRRPFVTHVVFSLHFYTFLLMLFCVSLGVVGVNLFLGGAGLNSEPFDHALSIVEVAVCATYLYVATATVYGGRGTIRVLKVVPLVVAAAGIVLGYRFVLFILTLYTN